MTSTNKPLLLFDIDLTLYDSLHFRKMYPSLMAGAMNISLETLIQTQKSYTGKLERSTDFHPEDYLHHIADTHHFSYQKLHDIYYNPELFGASLYPDTIPALEKLQTGYTLGIYSEGNHDFQITKLKLSGIYQYFDPKFIYIHPRKLNPEIVRSLPEKTTIIDDRLEIISVIHNYRHLIPIWLNRHGSKIYFHTKSISDLKQLVSAANRILK